ncbi:MAG TPA: YidB family protein [Steroidobacteraceae bacterium]|nr:YidB family protein [Steroidobacteraceae bacterium]
MGVLDQFGGAVGSVLGQGKNAGVSAVLLQQLIAMLSKPGALANLTNAFQSAGLGNILQSWIGTGQNLPISAGQVQKVLGSGTVADLAKKAGIGESETTSALASLLPQVIDKVSPGGSVPAQNDLGGALASLGKLLG